MHPTARLLADHALHRFVAEGYDQVSTADIATAAGVSQRTFFRHFATKDEALFAPADEATTDFVNRLYSQPIELPVTEALAAAIRAHEQRWPPSDDDLARYRLVLATPSLMDASLAYQGRFESALASWIAQRHQRRPEDLEVRVVAAALVAARRVVIDAWFASDFEADVAELAARAVAFVDPTGL